MPKVVTQADLLGHLREHCIEGVESADAPMAQTSLYCNVVKGVYDVLKDEPLRLLSDRQKGGG